MKRALHPAVWLVILALAAAAVVGFVLMTPRHAPEGSPDIAAKSQAFSEKVAAEKAAAEKAVLEATTVLAKPADGKALKVLYAGDSITEGYGATAPAQNFRELTLASIRQTVPADPTVAGKSGQTTAQATPAALAAAGPFDLLIVELGANDVINTPDTQAFRDAYQALISGLREKSPNAGLVCLGPWGDKKKADPYDVIVQGICEAAGGQFRTLGTYYNTEVNRWVKSVMPDGTKTDNFHPSDTGHAAIAKQALSAIRFS